MKTAACILLLTNCSLCFAQTFLNGDFEINSEATCGWNLSNAAFSSSMANAIAYGISDEVDIQETSCGYSAAQSGNWFISVVSYTTTGGLGSDEVSLELSAPLVPGQGYKITYYEQSDTTFASSHATPLPYDSLQFGISNSATSFGTLIYTSLAAVDTWVQRDIIFDAPFAGNYITVRGKNENYGWTFLDNFSIEEYEDTLTTPGLPAASDLFIPNIFTPNSDNINDVVDFSDINFAETYIAIYDRWGTAVYKSAIDKKYWDGRNLNGTDCSDGVYYYTLETTGIVNKTYNVKGFIQLLR